MKRFSTNFYGLIGAMILGLCIGVLSHISTPDWLLYTLGAIGGLIFLASSRVEDHKVSKISGELYLLRGEDKDHMAIGVRITCPPEELLQMTDVTFSVDNRTDERSP